MFIAAGQPKKLFAGAGVEDAKAPSTPAPAKFDFIAHPSINILLLWS